MRRWGLRLRLRRLWRVMKVGRLRAELRRWREVRGNCQIRRKSLSSRPKSSKIRLKNRRRRILLTSNWCEGVMGVHEGRGQLNKAMKELNNRWLEARGQWQDVQAENLEKSYLVPLEADLKNAIGAMVHMAMLLYSIGRV